MPPAAVVTHILRVNDNNNDFIYKEGSLCRTDGQPVKARSLVKN